MYLKRDSDGQITLATNYQVGWSPATAGDPPVSQVDIDAYDLEVAQDAKMTESESSLQAWRDMGFTYTGSLPGPATFNLSENSARYADVKSSRRLGGVNKSKFYDMAVPRVQRDFVDDTGFDGFVDAINEEEERIVEKENGYGEQIEEATTVAEVDAITINYAP